jgi:hypothetical protein
MHGRIAGARVLIDMYIFVIVDDFIHGRPNLIIFYIE